MKTLLLLNESESLEINLAFGIDYPADGDPVEYDQERMQDFDIDEAHEYRDECESEDQE